MIAYNGYKLGKYLHDKYSNSSHLKAVTTTTEAIAQQAKILLQKVDNAISDQEKQQILDHETPIELRQVIAKKNIAASIIALDELTNSQKSTKTCYGEYVTVYGYGADGGKHSSLQIKSRSENSSKEQYLSLWPASQDIFAPVPRLKQTKQLDQENGLSAARYNFISRLDYCMELIKEQITTHPNCNHTVSQITKQLLSLIELTQSEKKLYSVGKICAPHFAELLLQLTQKNDKFDKPNLRQPISELIIKLKTSDLTNLKLVLPDLQNLEAHLTQIYTHVRQKGIITINKEQQKYGVKHFIKNILPIAGSSVTNNSNIYFGLHAEEVNQTINYLTKPRDIVITSDLETCALKVDTLYFNTDTKILKYITKNGEELIASTNPITHQLTSNIADCIKNNLNIIQCPAESLFPIFSIKDNHYDYFSKYYNCAGIVHLVIKNALGDIFQNTEDMSIFDISTPSLVNTYIKNIKYEIRKLNVMCDHLSKKALNLNQLNPQNNYLLKKHTIPTPLADQLLELVTSYNKFQSNTSSVAKIKILKNLILLCYNNIHKFPVNNEFIGGVLNEIKRNYKLPTSNEIETFPDEID